MASIRLSHGTRHDVVHRTPVDVKGVWKGERVKPYSRNDSSATVLRRPLQEDLSRGLELVVRDLLDGGVDGSASRRVEGSQRSVRLHLDLVLVHERAETLHERLVRDVGVVLELGC